MSLLVFAMVSAVLCLRLPNAHAATVPSIDPTPAGAGDANAGDATDQVIVHLRSGAVRADAAAAVNAAGGSAEAVHALASHRQRFVVKLDHVAEPVEMASLVADLTAQPDVLAAEPDRRMHTLTVPNDPYYSAYQWDLGAPSASAYGINAAAAWGVTTGSPSVRIAVLDTGYLNHADLAGRFVGGFDFVSDIATANDGNSRDPDARDPGDWVTLAESLAGPFRGCSVEQSSWHGSHVAGTIGAATNNARGVAGINWVSPIVPVRVLGKCGGYTSDIVDGMRWAAGLAVAGVPANAYPAKVLNLSIGGSGPCSGEFQSAINDVIAAGASVVVAAGNDNSDVVDDDPGSCDGVITVAATSRTGNKATYSNFGAQVAIAAPGGDISVMGAQDGILSTVSAGAQGPTIDAYSYYDGTSMATPHVSGEVSLMLSVNPSLTPAQVRQIVQRTATPFPTTSSCSTSTCGAGIANAACAVVASQASLVPPGFTAITPVRLADTRPSEPQQALAVVKQKYGGVAVLQVPITAGGCAAGVATAASLNVTVVDPDRSGYVTAYPCGGALPTVSTVNFIAGQAVANAVVAPVSAQGTVCLYSNVPAHLVVDMNGWFAAGSAFNSVTPQRLVDTRPDYGQGLIAVSKQLYGGQAVLTMPIADVGGVPAAGASAVALNITVTTPVASGFVTAYPCGALPAVSSLNFLAGQTVANAVLAPLSADGRVCLYSNVPTHLVVDIDGWFATGPGFTALAPARLVDTRPSYGQGVITVGKQQYGGGAVLQLPLLGAAGLPGSGVGAVALNITATEPVGTGFVTAYPCGSAVPGVSTVNFVAGQTVANAAVVPVSGSGQVCLYSNVLTHLVVDINGWLPT